MSPQRSSEFLHIMAESLAHSAHTPNPHALVAAILAALEDLISAQEQQESLNEAEKEAVLQIIEYLKEKQEYQEATRLEPPEIDGIESSTIQPTDLFEEIFSEQIPLEETPETLNYILDLIKVFLNDEKQLPILLLDYMA